MVRRADFQTRVATQLPQASVEPKAPATASTVHGDVPVPTPGSPAGAEAPPGATATAPPEPKAGWTKEPGAVPPPLAQDALLSTFAESLVGTALEKAATEGDLNALVGHFAAMPEQLKEAFATPRGRAAFLALLSGYATRFVSLSMPQTPQGQQQLADRLGSLLLFMGKPVPAPTASKQGPVPKPQGTAEVRARMIDQVATSLAHPAVETLQDERGRSPAQAAQAMFGATTPRELDAKTSERFTLKAEIDARASVAAKGPEFGGAAALGSGNRSGNGSVEDEEAQRSRQRSRSGVLGGNMLWNALHGVDSDDPDELEKRDGWNRVLVSAALLLLLGAAIVVALVWLS